MSLAHIVVAPGVDRAEALRLVGSLEAASEHPIAQAIARAAGAPVAVESFVNHAGLGVEGVVDGHAIVAGRPSLLADWGLELDDVLGAAVREAHRAGETAIVAGWDGQPCQ